MSYRLPPDLVDIHIKVRKKPDFHPETSSSLYQDLYGFIVANHRKGCGIIEIGCYKGASSIVLAHACKTYGWPFYTLDINQSYLDYTCAILTEFGLANNATFYLGPMSKFVEEVHLEKRPVLIFVDGDHSYSGVVKDIQAILAMPFLPCGIAFHDFSLRTHNPAYPDTFVDKAIFDTLEQTIRFKRIGTQFGANPVPSKENPSASGSYWEYQGSEGALIRANSIRWSFFKKSIAEKLQNIMGKRAKKIS